MTFNILFFPLIYKMQSHDAINCANSLPLEQLTNKLLYSNSTFALPGTTVEMYLELNN